MKRMNWVLIIVSVLFISLAGCSSLGNIEDPAVSGIRQGTEARPGESIVRVGRAKAPWGFATKMAVWIDDFLVAKGMGVGDEVSFIVPNGTHTVRTGQSKNIKGKRR